MLAYDKINHIHIELTTVCNAHCPACGRNNNGFGLKNNFKLQDLSFERFIEVCDMLPNLQTVQLCGSLGDPIAAKRIMDVVDEGIKRKYILRIHTNGGMKTTDWWKSLGEKLANSKLEHTVIFGIDGLEDTHSIHRQGVSFQKVIDNAKSFIDAGGSAEWQFLLFKHNQHQVKDCMRLSQKMGFYKFYTRNSIRVPNPARHYQTGEPYVIERAEEYKTMESYDMTEKTLEVKDCFHLSHNSIYMNASGFIGSCCYLTWIHQVRGIEYEGNTLDEEITSGNASDNCKNFCSTFKK